MSNEDSLSEMNVAPARLMPKTSSLPEHHRILNLSAVHHGNTLATIKAHKVRQDHLQEQQDSLEEQVEEIRDLLKNEIAEQREASKEFADQVNRSLVSHGNIIGEINQRLAIQATGIDLKKAIVTGIVSVLLAAITAYGGYMVGHKPDAVYEPATRQQLEERAEKIKAFDPHNLNQVNR